MTTDPKIRDYHDIPWCWAVYGVQALAAASHCRLCRRFYLGK